MEQMQLLLTAFPIVIEVPVSWGQGDSLRKASRYKALVNQATRKVFSIVSQDYKLVRHEEAINEIEKAMGETPDLGNFEVTTDFYNDGGRMLREYTFQDHQIPIQPGDLVRPKLQLSNSYDLTWPFTVTLGAYRLVCTNGLVVNQSLFQVKKRHVFYLENLKLKENVSTALKRFSQQAKEWKKWAEVPLSEKNYDRVMGCLDLGKKATEEVNGKIHQEAVGSYREGFPLVTLWMFFNILTWYITHRAVSLNHRVNMENRLRLAMAWLRRK